jgi:hypothetical protein
MVGKKGDPAMTWQRMVLAGLLMPAALTAWSVCAAAQETKPRTTEVGKPKQSVERPFGGPPNRNPQGLGKQCAAESVTCPAEKPTKVGTDCWCASDNGQKLQGRIIR